MTKEQIKALLIQLTTDYVETAWEQEDEPEKLSAKDRVYDLAEYLHSIEEHVK